MVGGCSASEVSPFLRCNSLPRSASLPTELREDGFQPQTYLVQGVKALHAALKLWMKKEVSSFLWGNDGYCFYGKIQSASPYAAAAAL